MFWCVYILGLGSAASSIVPSVSIQPPGVAFELRPGRVANRKPCHLKGDKDTP